MIGNARRNDLISQHIEVALVYKDMLGIDEARGYLEREHIPRDVADRILSTDHKRGQAGTLAPAGLPEPWQTCRRRNLVHDAIVEAALKIEQKRGADAARGLLQAEGVPAAVADRVLSQWPRQIRQRQRSC